MRYFSQRITGVPFGRTKTRGNLSAPKKWSENIIEQTQSLPKVTEACIMKITFLLPSDKFPTDFPYGPDLDNLAKRTLDALNKTIFSEAKGHDSCVIELNLMKTKVPSTEESGVFLEILPVKI
jgi:Holliday junction resolvase RusA-like endonuclease